MPSVLIAGCGYVGLPTADLFHAQGWQVEGWTSSPVSAQALSSRPYPIRPVDLTEAAAVVAAASNFDVVIHCASSRGGDADAYRAIYLGGARNLAAAMPRALLLFTSSTSVYPQAAGEWVDEGSIAEPLRPTGRILRETEELVLAVGGIVARLAGIYGPGRSALLRKFLDGTAVMEAGDDRFVNQIHRDDVATALFHLVQTHLPGREAIRNERSIYNIADGHPITRRECLEWLAARMARPVPPISTAPTERKRGNSNKRVSSKKLRRLGWSPRYPDFATAMIESILPDLARSGS